MAVLAKLGWKILGAGSGVVARIVTKKLLATVWGAAKGTRPPANPKRVDVSWQEAVSWTIASSAGVGVASLLSQRAAAGWWRKATGSLPPGFTPPADTLARPGHPLPRA